MLTAHNISKSYSIHQILQDVSFTINPNDRVGLIGPNGCGKTTLLRILATLEVPDSGTVTPNPGKLRIGYLAQGFGIDPSLSLGDVIGTAWGDLSQVEGEVARLATALADDPQLESLQRAYNGAINRLERWSELDPGYMHSILGALGLSQIPLYQPVGAFSGGQKTRLSLALVLLERPDLLLLDEPTNHLDIQMLEWLEAWLSTYPGAALIVSHDRTFLDNTVIRILDLDPESHTIREYIGNYSDYLEQFIQEREKQEAAYRDQVYEIRRMKQDIARTKQQALRVELTTSSRQPGVRRYAKKVAKKAKARERKLERYLKSDERAEKPKQSWQMKLEFSNPSHQNQDALVFEDLSVGYSEYQPLLINLNLHVRSGVRIALTGPNGSGKTTLLRTIAGQIEPLAGKLHLGSSIHLGYMSQEQETLDPNLKALDIILRMSSFNETEARSFLHFFLFTEDDPLRPTRDLSHGERARLILASLTVQGCNFLLLDEPINHLDIPSRARFEQALNHFEGTVLAVVHDRYFISRFASEVWMIKDQKIITTW